MKKNLPGFILCFSLFLFASTLNAQWATFQKSYGTPGIDCEGYSITSTSDGGYILGGRKYDGMYNSEMMIVKLNAFGDTLWTRFYGDTALESALSIVEYAGGYRVFGNTTSFGFGSGDMMMLELNSQGDSVRSRVYGGPNDDFCIGGNTIQQTLEGDLIFIGQTNSFGAGLYDMIITRIDVSGNIVWSKTYGGVNSEQQGAIALTSDRGFAGLGLTTSFGAGGVDFYLVKTDSLGNLLWSKSYGTTNHEYGFGLIQTSDQGYLLTGMIQYSSGDDDVLVIKTDSLGNIQWSKTYSGPNSEWAFAAEQIPSGEYIITGRTISYGNGGEDVFLLRLDATGNMIWSKAYGLNNNDYAYAVLQTSDGGFIACGTTTGVSTPRNELFVVKTDINGNSGCNETIAPFIVQQITLVGAAALTLTGNGCAMNYSSPAKTSGCMIATRCFDVGISEDDLDDHFEIYPNPSEGIFNLLWKNFADGNLKVYNSIGEEVMRVNDFSDSQIDLTSYPSGIYLVTLQIGTEMVKKKIVVK